MEILFVCIVTAVLLCLWYINKFIVWSRRLSEIKNIQFDVDDFFIKNNVSKNDKKYIIKAANIVYYRLTWFGFVFTKMKNHTRVCIIGKKAHFKRELPLNDFEYCIKDFSAKKGYLKIVENLYNADKKKIETIMGVSSPCYIKQDRVLGAH